MKRLKYPKTNRYDFQFKFKGYGTYLAIYISPVTGKKWQCITHDTEMIDRINNHEQTQKDLEILKGFIKENNEYK